MGSDTKVNRFFMSHRIRACEQLYLASLLFLLQTSSCVIPLFGVGSTDDYNADKMTYKWEEVSGPLETHLPSSTDPVLTLRGLVAGTYILK